MVQLTKLDTPPTKSMTAEELTQLWEKIDKKEVVQYKLKVELGPEVVKIVQEAGGEAPGPN